MINIGRSIVQVLGQHPEVEVPGIGIFKKVYISAFFDEEAQTFKPPTNLIALMPNESGVFSIKDYLKIQYRWNDEEAQRALSETLAQLFDRLHRHGRVFLEEVGHLEREDDALKLLPIDISVIDFPEAKELPGVLQSFPYSYDEENKAEPTDRKSSAGLWIAAMLLVLMIATGITWALRPSWFGNVTPKEAWADITGKSDKVIPRPDGEEPAETASPVILDSLPAQEVRQDDTAFLTEQETDSVMVQPPANDVTANGPSVTYEIIVASFETMRQAEQYVEEMKAKGHSNLRTINSRRSGNRKKVSWGGYASREAAYRELPKVQREIEKTAWVDQIQR